MSSSLVIVESPAKARTIANYLKDNFVIKASVGHIKDLPESRLGVDIESGFVPQYQVIKGKIKILKEIKKAAEKADSIYLATDPDREGEAIAWHIAEELNRPPDKIHRVLFNEITSRSVREAILKPERLNKDKFEAQQARRILDRLVGYLISPLLWDKVRRGLSAGRVQSVAVRLICEREKEIQAFISQEYWTIQALLEGSAPPSFQAILARIDSKKANIKNEGEAQAILKDLSSCSFSVKEVERKERKKNPSPPYITSHLQQEAWRKLRFTAKKTMSLAQRLYEGVDLGQEGPVGLITYMRTDSVRISPEAVQDVRRFIAEKFGPEYLPEKPNFYKSRKTAQEAHEAIRPTSVIRDPAAVKPFLDKDQFALYELIWNRFVACQMNQAVYDQTAVEIQAGKYLFRANGSTLLFPGFMTLYIETADENAAGENQEEGKLPDLTVGEALKPLQLTPEQHFTQPPPRYTEATLIRELEEKGIGRPSTYAAILDNIQEREYVAKEKGRLYPTELGCLVSDLLVENFPAILDVQFTAQMEDELDKVEEGRLPWVQALEDFYEPFQKDLEKAKLQMQDLKGKGMPTDLRCDKCDAPMVIKLGRHGQFLACSNYPECKNTKEFQRNGTGEVEIVREEPVQEACEKCGASMAVKTGRFGKFLACSNYPKCKNTKKILVNGEGKIEVTQDEKSSETCDKCGAPMVIKTGRFGKFLACSTYPKCKNTQKIAPAGGESTANGVSNHTGDDCEKCGSPLVYRRGRFGQFIACSNYPKCRYTKKMTSAHREGRETPEEKGPSASGKKVYKKKKI
ncbi:MAG: type I DNA topoisomerase [Thermodesulfobacteriota bacterium]|nr:type I DNA topoisomerase [Thermodesulfobacteriota bacterium]